ncbi:MAG: SDR family NAD(P)-dependent oxidoreductase [Novosphingobium sp.]
MDSERYGPWALIVGGSEGIGAEMARQLAADRFSLVLVARKAEPLDLLKAELSALGVQVRIASVDLSQAAALDQVRAVTDDIDVGLLVYNAGANSVRGRFVELDPAVTRAMLMINAWNQAEFARHYGARMAQRGRGGIILCGSSSSYLGAPTLAAYTGAKAFSRVFTEALWAEMEPLGVDVLHLLVNFTATPAMERLGIDTSAAMTSADVAAQGLAHIARGPIFIAGGDRALAMVEARSQVHDRADVVRKFATPTREAIEKK